MNKLLIIDRLLPCPFCGGKPEITHCEEDCCGAKPRWIYCECGCELGGLWQNDDEAITQWNYRSDSNLKSKIKCLENAIEHLNNIPSEYKYIWGKDWDEMTPIEQNIWYKTIPAAKLVPVNAETTEDYLRKYSVLDGMGNMDGTFVPISIAMIAIQRALDYELEHKQPSWISKYNGA